MMFIVIGNKVPSLHSAKDVERNGECRWKGQKLSSQFTILVRKI